MTTTARRFHIRKALNLLLAALCLCLLGGVTLFAANASSTYKVNSGFKSLPLDFDPYSSTSSYQKNGLQVTVRDGFVKGTQTDADGITRLLVRALSPEPRITIQNNTGAVFSLLLENVNPELYAKAISQYGFQTTKIKTDALQLDIPASAGKIDILANVIPVGSDFKYVVLGDNRDGYATFQQIIDQVNGQKPAFVIDNGDLVFSGKPNQYRLFDQMTSKIAFTFCTTLGNHDIRGNGRNIYTMLYGPAYYSFDLSDSHFIFLDSSPGWSEKRAISEEQYKWLEADLKKAKGKHICVISHIPPHDPRSGTKPNTIKNFANKVENGDNAAEQMLNNYNENKNMEHGFQDPQEAERFETLMSRYKVSTVYLSHIHSYFDYTRDHVRYLISGGAGAELLTKDSYYHYMIANTAKPSDMTMVELPSPANSYIARYGATASLFATAMYLENKPAVILFVTGLSLLALLLLLKLYMWRSHFFNTLGKWLKETAIFSYRRFRELFSKSKNQD